MRVVIIGSGIIGRCWSLIFARAKCEVFLFDTVTAMLDLALAEIDRQLEQLGQYNLLFNQSRETIMSRIHIVSTQIQLNDIFQQGIDHIQECIPEDVELKRKLFLEFDMKVPANVLIASSSSCIVPSQFTEKMQTRNRCIVA